MAAEAVDDVLDNAVKREAAALALEVSVEHVSALHNRVVHSLEAMQTTGAQPVLCLFSQYEFNMHSHVKLW